MFHQAAHGFCHRAADTGVHFVKDQRLRCTQLAGGDGYCQGYARKFAAGGYFTHGAWRAGGMTGHQKLDLFQAMAGSFWQGFQRHFKPATLHTQVLHGGGDTRSQFRRGSGAGFAELFGLLHEGQRRQLFGFFQGFKVCCGVQFLHLRLPARVKTGQFSRGSFVAPGQRYPQTQAGIQFI